MERLRDAAAQGRIDFEELGARVGQALKSKTHAESAALAADLPRPTSPEPRPPLALKGGMYGASRGRRAGRCLGA